ncbi:dsDNA nuclease domain-containing protein [Methylobacterium sp. CM6244]
MSLAANLIAIPARARAATGDRYDYQTMWGLALLFEQHSGTKDYAIVFEFHDDIALLDSSTNPEKIRFYQVKTKLTYGGWTLASLLSRPK